MGRPLREPERKRKRPWYVDRCVELLEQLIAGKITQQEMRREIRAVELDIKTGKRSDGGPFLPGTI